MLMSLCGGKSVQFQLFSLTTEPLGWVFIHSSWLKQRHREIGRAHV